MFGRSHANPRKHSKKYTEEKWERFLNPAEPKRVGEVLREMEIEGIGTAVADRAHTPSNYWSAKNPAITSRQAANPRVHAGSSDVGRSGEHVLRFNGEHGDLDYSD